MRRMFSSAARKPAIKAVDCVRVMGRPADNRETHALPRFNLEAAREAGD